MTAMTCSDGVRLREDVCCHARISKLGSSPGVHRDLLRAISTFSMQGINTGVISDLKLVDCVSLWVLCESRPGSRRWRPFDGLIYLALGRSDSSPRLYGCLY
jgi:hypothetical protein